MSQAFGISEFKPLSIGAVVTGAVQLYRDNFKEYFKIAFFSTLWLIVPVFGWAKGIAGFALISRLAFNQISGRSESFDQAFSIVDRRKWKFLGAILLFFVIYFLAYIASIFAIFVPLIPLISLGQSLQSNPLTLIGFGLALLLIVFLVIGFLFWMATRFFVQDVALAIEEGLGAAGTLQRSWVLTKGSVFRLQLVLLVATLITGPFLIVSQLVSFAFQSATRSDANPVLALLFTLVLLGVTLANSAFLTPFWQSVKALVYADLLVRREGVDLDLRGQ